MTIDRALLEILACPVRKTPVKLLTKDKIAILNREIEQGRVQGVGGQTVSAPLEAALITEDGRTIYRIDDDIPVMLEEEGIAAEQITGW